VTSDPSCAMPSKTLPFRTDRADGLPILGSGERYFHVSFEVVGESDWIEGVVAADTSKTAASLLLSAEAHARFKSYGDLMAQTRDNRAYMTPLTVEQALELLPKVRHGVSMWSSSPGEEVPERAGQLLLAV